jgi:hypothetical protein
MSALRSTLSRTAAAVMASVTMAVSAGPGVAFAQQAKPTEQLMTACQRAQQNRGSLVASDSAQNCYRGRFINLIATTSKDGDAQIAAGSFMHKLHQTMSNPSDTTRIIVVPDKNSNNTELLVIAGVVPSKAAETQPVTFCAQQNGRTIVAGKITHKGEILPADIISNPAGSTRAACNATIIAAKAALEYVAVDSNTQSTGPGNPLIPPK